MNISSKIIKLDEVDSTNNYLSNMELPRDVDLLVAVADSQTSGKGMGTNKWESEKGANLLLSLMTSPVRLPLSRRYDLVMTGALALKDAIGIYGIDVRLKWPNDIYWNDRKLSGTLIETSLCGHTIKSCIYGIGINVNQCVFHSDAPNPVSMKQILGHDVDLNELLNRFLKSFGQRYSAMFDSTHDIIEKEYFSVMYRNQGLYEFSDAYGRFKAEIEGVKRDGRIVLRDDKGMERIYGFKEINYII